VDLAERASCPLDLLAVSASVCLGAVVGRQLAIRPKRLDDWTVVPNLWGAGVLPPGWLKSYCLESPMKPLARLEDDAREQYARDLADFEVAEAVAAAQTEAAKLALKEAARVQKGRKAATPKELEALAAKAVARPAGRPPTLRRYTVNDTTVEKLGELLAGNPQGLLIYRDELMGFLMSLEKPGREGDRAFYLESWNGTGSFSYDRIGRGSLFIPSNTVSILGGIQPGKLAAYIREAASGDKDDGLISRFQLLVYPDVDQPYKRVDREPDTQAQEQAYQLFQKLAYLDYAALGAAVDGPRKLPYLRFCDAAQMFFDDWFETLENRVRSCCESPYLIGHLAKYRSLMPSLALLFHLVEVLEGSARGAVSFRAASRATSWCDYLEQHAKRVYQAAFDSDPEPAQRLAERLPDDLPDPFTTRDIQRKGWKFLGSIDEIHRALGLLERHGWIYAEEVPTTPHGGRPTTHYHKNPRLLQRDP
jgi:putative DNA primase/helicase